MEQIFIGRNVGMVLRYSFFYIYLIFYVIYEQEKYFLRLEKNK